MRSLRILFSVYSLLAISLFSGGPRVASAESSNTPFLYTVTPKYVSLAWLRGEERFPRGAQVWMNRDEQNHVFVNGFASTADPSVSFDAAHVLFAGKQYANERWQIWEFSFSDNKLTQLTSCTSDCIRPFYLPDDRIVYARKSNGRFVLEAAARNGKDQTQLTYAPGNFLPNDVLLDGRILFTSAFPLGSANAPDLYTVYSDGSGVESYRCDHVLPRFGGKQVASGDIVFTHGAGLARFTSPLATEAPIALRASENTGEVAELSEDQWLLSQRERPVAHFEITEFDRRAQSSTVRLSDAANDLVQPVLLVPRVVPNRHPSGLHDWQVANLLTLNVNVSRDSLPDVKAAEVRGYTLDGSGRKTLLGIAPIANDGSFFVQVQGDQPVQFELVGKNGAVMARERGWFWSRKGEQRICVGCHAGPEHAPENAIPQILLQSTEPAKMISADPARKGGKK